MKRLCLNRFCPPSRDRRRWLALASILTVALLALSLPAQDEAGKQQRRGAGGKGKQQHGRRGKGERESSPEQEMPPWTIVLGRPTDRSVTVNLLANKDLQVYFEYGTQPGKYIQRTDALGCQAGVPVEVVIDKLKPDTGYYYRLRYRETGATPFAEDEEHTFHTQRAPGSTFTFALQGDSHPEREGKMYDPDLYAQTMRNVAKNPPDFYLTMGDDFSIDHLIERKMLSQTAVDQIYAHQRSFLGVVGRSAALFLVNGNHEHADRYLLDGTENNGAVMAGRARTRFYPLPAPDGFYTGDTEEVKYVGLPRDYYSWTWGDALFVVIDFYWHSPVPVDHVAGAERHKKGEKKGGGKTDRDLWAVTLGDAQYRWLTKTLTESKARFKFVFCHHVLGTGRGGIELADQYEWGGRDKRGVSDFKDKRPGWELPIHALMVKTGVTIFFQGHDHLYARQELDGVVYQSCPNPADPTYQAFNSEAYRSGDVLPNSGHLRVTVSPDCAKVDYIRSYLPEDETDGHKNGEVAHSYTCLPAKHKVEHRRNAD